MLQILCSAKQFMHQYIQDAIQRSLSTSLDGSTVIPYLDLDLQYLLSD